MPENTDRLIHGNQPVLCLSSSLRHLYLKYSIKIKIYFEYILRGTSFSHKIKNGAAVYGRRLFPPENPRYFGAVGTRKPKVSLKGGDAMLTIEGFIAVIALCISCFSFGFEVGKQIKK